MSLSVDHVLLVLGDGDQRVTVLDDVSMNVRAGGLTAVVGPSGSGKSSLLAVAGGLRTPTSGSVAIDGTVISDLTPAARTRTSTSPSPGSGRDTSSSRSLSRVAKIS